jgi:hypothetical protein
MDEPLKAPLGDAGEPGTQLGRIGMICTLAAMGALAAMFLFRPG